MLRNLIGKASTLTSRVTWEITPPRFTPGALADERHRDLGVDRLVEAHLLQVDVRDRAADRIAAGSP